MLATTLRLDGMMCSMCESHVNDAIRRALPVKKVSSSHKKGLCVILSEEPLAETTLHAALDPLGYRLLDVQVAPYEKKGLFSRFL